MILFKVILLLFGSGPVLSHKLQFKGPKSTVNQIGLEPQPDVVTASPQQLSALGPYGVSAKDLWDIHNPDSWEPKVVKVEITHELIKEVSPKLETSPKLESSGWVPMTPSWNTNANNLKPLYPGAKGLYQWSTNSQHETWKHNIYAPHVQKPYENKYLAPKALQQKVPHIYAPITYSPKNPHIYAPITYSPKNPHIYSPNAHSQKIRWSEPDPYAHAYNHNVHHHHDVHHNVHHQDIHHDVHHHFDDNHDVHHHFDDHHNDYHHHDDDLDNYHHSDDYHHYDEDEHDDFHHDDHDFDHHYHHKDRGYNFNYGVESSHTGDVKTHQERKNGGNVEGKYTVKEADGSTREVHYTAGKHTGFNAVVRNRGKLSSAHPIHSHHHGWKGQNRIYRKAQSHQHVSKDSYPHRHTFIVKHAYKS